MRKKSSVAVALSFWALSSTLFAQAPASAPDPQALLALIDAATLQPENAVALKKVKLVAGLATLTLEGKLIPVAPVGGQVRELVFFGQGRIELSAPDEIEAGQLELFTGAPGIDESFDQAVFVFGLDRAVEALLKRPAATLDEAEARRAREIYDQWKKGPERELLDIRGAIWSDALGDAPYQNLFAGRFHGNERGDFLYLVDPQSEEQVTLGQFVPIEATEKEKRKIIRRLAREQRRGRLIGLELDDLGQWDTWLSSSLRTKEGKPVPGAAAFEPVRYNLDVTVEDPIEKLHGVAKIELRPVLAGVRTVEIRLPRGFEVRAVCLGDAKLPFERSGAELTAVLPQAPLPDGTVTIAVEYEGVAIGGDAKSYALLDTQNWYPHVGLIDRATYEATFHWPRRFDLLASGHRLEGGETGDLKWTRHRLDLPTWGYTFEIGKFSLEQRQVGHVAVTLAFDPTSRKEGRANRKEIGDTVAEALSFFETTFGPYPLDELTVSTIPRGFSQSMLGFITLSDLMMLDTSFWTLILGFEDRRSVIAHEVAHQWWGHRVGWASDRDIWLSEAMANYSALLYQDEKIEPATGKKIDRKSRREDVLVGPTSGWQSALAATLPNERAIDSVGPVVLGSRLFSSRTNSAYEPIVYKKGAVILDMLARSLGPEQFPKIMHEVVRVVDGRTLSTRDFFDLIERITDTDLESFVSRFVEGTGLPEVYYTYKYQKEGDGKWRVLGEARIDTPYRFRYRAVSSAQGFDVTRERQDTIRDLGNLALTVPVQVSFYDPTRDESKKNRESPEPNALLKGRMVLRGERVPIDIPVDFEPRRFWLDRDQRVYGRFFDESRNPKRMLYYRGSDQSAAGRHDEAVQLLNQALAAEVWSGDERDKPTGSVLASERRLFDGRIQLSLARIALDQGRDAEAQIALDKAKKGLRLESGGWAAEELRVIESRLDLRRGDYERVFRRLNKALLKRADIDSTEGFVLLAIAAQKTGHAEELQKAKDAVKEAGSDLSVLGN